MARKKAAIPQHLITQQTATLPSTPIQRFFRKFKKIRHIKPANALLYLFMLALICFMMLPLVYMVVTAFKPIDELLIYPPRFYVSHPTFSNFINLSKALSSTTVPFSRYVLNSIIVTVISVFLTCVVCAMGAYALSKIKLKGANFIFGVLVAALSFGSHVTAIPSYLIVNSLHLNNTYWVMIIPKIVSAYHLFLLKQFCEQIPDEFIEAAYLDGGGEWTIFWRIIMPCLKPSLASVIVFAFVANWNDSFYAMVYITDESLKVLPLALQLISQTGTLSLQGAMQAANLITTAPTITIYVIMQNQVLNAMGYSGIKS